MTKTIEMVGTKKDSRSQKRVQSQEGFSKYTADKTREITRREVREKKSFSKLIRGHKLQRASRRLKIKNKLKEKLKKGLCFPIYRSNRFV